MHGFRCAKQIEAPLLILVDWAMQLLNVQVPFYFKSIVDSLNIPLSELTAEQTVWTLGGTAVVGCKQFSLCNDLAAN